MRLSDVINRFTLVSGLKPEEISKWTVICVDAMNEVARLKKHKKREDEKDSLRLSNLAGVYAYYKYCMYTYSSKIESFSAGMISVKEKDDGLERARELWETEKGLCSDLISDEGDFCFKGVAV